MKNLQNLNVQSVGPMPSPELIKEKLPLTEESCQTVFESRLMIENILMGKDDRMIAIVGPCSIHDTTAALEYAEKLLTVKKQLSNEVVIIMRVYFEKPRTTSGWKGLINDPYLDGSFDIPSGLEIARKLLLDITGMGLPIGTEILDPIVPQYIASLITWAAIGARTTESQTHREMASGLSMPVGFKNGTDGNIQIAIDAMEAAKHQHNFLGIDDKGKTCVINTKGNPLGHIVLRGGVGEPNYTEDKIKDVQTRLMNAGQNQSVMIDCSHANSHKKYQNQQLVWRNILQQKKEGNLKIIGMMLESNLFEGNQKLSGPDNLKYGVSITDECIGWDHTRELLLLAAKSLREKAAVGLS